MSVAFDIPWNRYALIAELAKRMNGVSPQFGKTALQKFVYFLQEIYGVDCGYEFELYSYGPFAAQLLGDLDLVAHFGCISIEPVLSGTGGYEIAPTEQADSIRSRAEVFLNDENTAKSLDALVEDFGTQTARDLELRATIVYVERDFRRKDRQANRSEVCHTVGQIKPKFLSSEIEQALDELSGKRHVQLNA